MHKTLFIINPNADMGHAWQTAGELRKLAEEYGGADWVGTVYPRHATELARQAVEQGYETVVACGGDGTVHEVVNGLMTVPRAVRPRLGVAPKGSGNDFAHAVGVSSDPAQAIRQIFSGAPKCVDIGWAQDGSGRQEYWMNALGIGFDTLVTLRLRSFRPLRGFAAYLTAVLCAIVVDHKPVQVRAVTDNESFQQDLLMFVLCNGPREGGGFNVQPDARLDDGVMHYAGIQDVSRLMMFRLLPEVMKGTHGRFKQVRMGSFGRMELLADRPLYIHMDGEIFAGFDSDVRKLTVNVLPGDLEVMV